MRMSMTTFLRKPFRYSYNNAVLILIGVNALVFLLTSLSREMYVYLSLIPVAIFQEGWIWQPFTYMFVHKDISHLLFNMLGLFFFGTAVERKTGSLEFVMFYLVVGTLAGLFSLACYTLAGTPQIQLVGASGAVYAVLFAFAVINPRSTIFIWGIIPVPAPLLVLGFAVIEIVSELAGARGNIAHLTHLAGFGFSALYFPIRHGVNPIRRLFPRGR
jgi:membrane associated rhomboid family serine protease